MTEITNEQFTQLLKAIEPRKGNTSEMLMKIATGVSTAGIVGAIFALFAMSESLTKVELSQGYIVSELGELKEFARAPRYTHSDAKSLEDRLAVVEKELLRRNDFMTDTRESIAELSFQVRNLKIQSQPSGE